MNTKYEKIGNFKYKITSENDQNIVIEYVICDCDIKEIAKLEKNIERYQNLLKDVETGLTAKKVIIAMVSVVGTCVITYIISNNNVFLSGGVGASSIIPIVYCISPSEKTATRRIEYLKDKIEFEKRILNNIKETSNYHIFEKQYKLKKSID